MFRGEISKTCYYCHKQVGSTLLFECSHYICNLCLYRQLFCYHLKDFQTLDQITVKCKCQDGSLTLSLDDIEEILKEKTFTDNCNSIEKFKDDDMISDWAKVSVLWAKANGIVSGRDDGTFDGMGCATRAEIATVIKRFYENVLK